MHEGYWSLFRGNDALQLWVLEEEEIYRRDAHAYASQDVAGLLLMPYQQSSDFLPVALQRHHDVGFDAVVPAWEYGVAASGMFAEASGLRWPGRRAIDACTDKIILREMLSSSGVQQPRWAQVESAEDLAKFCWLGPVVLKPSNRRASVGVIRVDHPEDVMWAWKECVSSGEQRSVPDRPRTVRFIAEDYMLGEQVSVETLVRDHVPIFDNVTRMITAGGPYFPMLSVTVPAPICSEDYENWVKASHALVEALQVENGVIHSEWKIVDGIPHLIECAARVPGDFIPELGERAYGGFNMYEAQVLTLAGTRVSPPGPAERIATTCWFHPRPGKVKAIRGTDALNNPAVFLHRLKVGVGDEIPKCTDSRQRVGYFCAQASSEHELEEVVARVFDAVEFEIE
jgi:biotin carboxylase